MQRGWLCQAMCWYVSRVKYLSPQLSESGVTQQQWQTEQHGTLHSIFIHIVLCLPGAMGPDSIVCLRIIYPLLHQSCEPTARKQPGRWFLMYSVLLSGSNRIGCMAEFENVLSHTSLNQVRSSPLTFHQKNQIPPLCLGNVFKLALWKHSVHSCRVMRPEGFFIHFKRK